MRTLAEAQRTLSSGATTARKLAEECLARATDPAGEGGRVFIALDADKVRAQADASDALRKHAIVPSPLAGLPITVKDLFDVQGEVTKAGSRALADRPPAAADAPAIARLRAAGAVLVGRTNMTEFAYSGVGLNPHYGTPKCPWDRAAGRIPGGSSSGAAVSVTDGMGLAGLGTDTGGSCRIPAALCGTVGWKPTALRIPIDGVVPLAVSLDSIGSMGASVACVALIDQVMAGEPVRPLPAFELRGRRLGVPKDYVLDGLDQTVAKAFERALKALADAGAQIEHCRFQAIQSDRLAPMFEKGGIAAGESSAWHKELIAKKGNQYDPRVGSRIMMGYTQTAADHLRQIALRRELCEELDRETARFDALLMPACPIVAPPIAAFAEDEVFRKLNLLLLRNTMVGNLMDRCAISIPCHGPGEGPAGLMLMGERGGDAGLLALSAAAERALAPARAV
jgi:aspartyl-tRNA(Asn)/glutamyl-tRNA(Gln) amidotransferase subunit A